MLAPAPASSVERRTRAAIMWATLARGDRWRDGHVSRAAHAHAPAADSRRPAGLRRCRFAGHRVPGSAAGCCALRRSPLRGGRLVGFGDRALGFRICVALRSASSHDFLRSRERCRMARGRDQAETGAVTPRARRGMISRPPWAARDYHRGASRRSERLVSDRPTRPRRRGRGDLVVPSHRRVEHPASPRPGPPAWCL
jgi:hypothetical protein